MPSSTTSEGVEYRIAQLESIRTKQFDLVYYGKFDYAATSSMTLIELDWYYNKLLETKKHEKEEQDKALAEAEKARRSPKLRKFKRR